MKQSLELMRKIKMKAKIDKLIKFGKGHEQVKEGQERIAKVIAKYAQLQVLTAH